MTDLVIPKGQGLFSWRARIQCALCRASFDWKDATPRAVSEDKDPDGVVVQAPSCPRCSEVIPAGSIEPPRRLYDRVMKMALDGHEPPIRKGAPCFVRGLKGGAITAFSFPHVMSNKTCGDRIDELLVNAGFPERYGSTWLRTAVWSESRERGGQDHESILVVWDGRWLSRTPATEWFTVVPDGMEA